MKPETPTKTDAELFSEKEKAENEEKTLKEMTAQTPAIVEKTEIAKIEQPENEELSIISPEPGNSSVFVNKQAFEHAQRVAIMLSKTDLIPDTYKNKIGNCMIALEMSNRIGASPLMVMQNLYIVHGRPAWSSQFLIATLNASGRFSPLRYEEDEKNGGRCRAFATDKSTGEICFGTWVSVEMANAENWSTKNGSKWKTMPQLMLRYRAAAFFTRQFAPEVSMGIMTQDEAYDINHEPATASRWAKPE